MGLKYALILTCIIILFIILSVLIKFMHMHWGVRYEIAFYEDAPKFSNGKWFWIDLVNSRIEGFLDVFLLNVTRNCDYLKAVTLILNNLLIIAAELILAILELSKKLPYVFGCIVAIHEWHAAVGED